MSSLKNKLKKLSFFTHYPKEHESITYSNVIEEYPSKEEMWNEWFSSYYINGKWYLGEPLTILKFTGESFTTSNNGGNFSDAIVNWGDGTVESPIQLTHTYATNEEHIIKIINAPYDESSCFTGCNMTTITIPSSVTSLGAGCFYGCTGLTNITIPSSVTSLGASCFYGCTGLTNITIPSSVTSLGNYCFHNCSNLIDITIPSSVTSLATSCFYGCTGLTNITIPSSITSLGSGCFRKCSNLMNVILNWASSDKIVTYNSNWISDANAQLKFIIPSGTTSLYTAKGYPSEKLEEEIS